MTTRSSTRQVAAENTVRGTVRPWNGAAAAPDSLLTDLVSWWSLDETSGARVDSHGSVDLTDNNTVGYAAGKVSNAAKTVIANNEYLSNFAAPSLDPGGGDITIAGWVNPTVLIAGTARIMLLSATNTNVDRVIILSINGTGDPGPSAVQLLVFDTAGTYFYVNSTPVVSAGAWTHVIASVDATAKQLSVTLDNGTPDISALGGTGVLKAGIDHIYLGSNYNQTLRYGGLLDEFQIVHRLLTPDEKTRLAAGMEYPG